MDLSTAEDDLEGGVIPIELTQIKVQHAQDLQVFHVSFGQTYDRLRPQQCLAAPSAA